MNIVIQPEETSAYGLIKFLKEKTNPIGLEIGVYNGINTRTLLKSVPGLTLYGIDPYIIFTDWNGRLTHHSDDPDRAEVVADKLLSPFKERFVKIKKTSDEALTMFQNNFFDFIFIDGLHTYEQVLVDCKNYYPKLKQNCVFSGHDYNTIAGVRQAVNEFAESVNKNILLEINDVWYFIK
jgi:hypothetical protein